MYFCKYSIQVKILQAQYTHIYVCTFVNHFSKQKCFIKIKNHPFSKVLSVVLHFILFFEGKKGRVNKQGGEEQR